MVLTETIKAILPLDKTAMAQAAARQDRLTKPRHSLGQLETLAVCMAGITGRAAPTMERKLIMVMAGDHGVAREGVSAYPPEVTAQMVANFLRGGAAINVLARCSGARLRVVDMGVASELAPHAGLISRKIAYGTASIARGPAMTVAQARRSLCCGIELVNAEIDAGLDIVGLGEMGIGNTTAASAICAVMMDCPVGGVTGRGTGLTAEQLAGKIKIIEAALALNRPRRDDALDVLAKVGGFEIGGLAGVILGAAARRIPVLVDGFITGSAALIACALAPQAKDYLIASHVSVEPGHQATLDYLGLTPLLSLQMRLGEGTGAALAMGLVEASVRLLNEMATFDAAGVTDREV